MATPEVHLVAADDDEYGLVVGVDCQCGWHQWLGPSPSLLEVLNTVGEHNSAAHLRPDNTGLRVRR